MAFYTTRLATCDGSYGTSHWVLHFDFQIFFMGSSTATDEKSMTELEHESQLALYPSFTPRVYYLPRPLIFSLSCSLSKCYTVLHIH